MDVMPTHNEDLHNNQGINQAPSIGKSMVTVNALAKLMPS